MSASKQELRDLYADMMDGIDLVRWISRGDFDPMHSMRELRAAAQTNTIELRIDRENPENTCFRFTPEGWARMAREQLEKLP